MPPRRGNHRKRGGSAWARDTGTPVVARSGGHSQARLSVGTGLVVDLGALHRVSADGSTGPVTAAGGARTADVYTAVRPHGTAFALGNGASAGIRTSPTAPSDRPSAGAPDLPDLPDQAGFCRGPSGVPSSR
ncbi:FAD-binding protein [Streptomyces sp. NPDC046866]|uniref:FAD-binding protein n=1 Tax=Streptomyces sp. NPDC046866 TaxID=3154921 RepID=UPI0034529E0A